MEIEFYGKNCEKYKCLVCDVNCWYKSDFEKHLLTRKHEKRTKMGKNFQNGNILGENLGTPKNKCLCCGKIYKTVSGLWKHNKVCNAKTLQDPTNKTTSDKDDLIDYLVKENKEFKNLILEIVKKDTYSYMNNSNNKSFNLNFFLNETCKDAMNIMEFVDSIQLQLSDLERVGELGYVEGISNIITTNLKKLDVTQRPVHCTDKKRETIYIKDANIWEKDAEQNKLRKAVKKVASKNQRLLPKFKEVHPDCVKSSSQYSDQYNKLIIEAMGGRGENDYEKEEKIIKKISKAVIVEKDVL